MFTTTITNLPNATVPLSGAERVPMDQAGVTVDAPVSAIAALSDPAGTAAAAVEAAAENYDAAGTATAAVAAAAGNYATAAQGAKADTAVVTVIAGITGAAQVTNVVSISQANYNAISSPSASTLYIITS